MKNFSTLKKYAELAWSAYGDFGDKNPLKKILEDIFYNAFPNFSTSTKIVSEPFCNCKKSSNKVVSFLENFFEYPIWYSFLIIQGK